MCCTPGAPNEAGISASCCAGTSTGGNCGGQSVLLSSGAFWFRKNLLSIGALNGVGWSFTLDYLAGNGVNDVLGKGFNFTQNVRLVYDPATQNVQLTTGQNTVEQFLSESGAYVPAANNNTRADLFRTGAGTSADTFTLRSFDGTVTTFFGFYASIASPGCISTIQDRCQNTQSYTWQLW
jgi:hypothetical protein